LLNFAEFFAEKNYFFSFHGFFHLSEKVLRIFSRATEKNLA